MCARCSRLRHPLRRSRPRRRCRMGANRGVSPRPMFPSAPCEERLSGGRSRSGGLS
jgi:hypothetical protein